MSWSVAAAWEIERFQRAAASLRDEAELQLLDSVDCVPSDHEGRRVLALLPLQAVCTLRRVRWQGRWPCHLERRRLGEAS